jgi:hypothetical protein
MKYIKLFEKYEDFKDANVNYSDTNQRLGYGSGIPYKYDLKIGDRVVVNGIHDGLVIKNQNGTILSIYNLSNFLIKFDNIFSPRLHNQSNTSKRNDTWYINPVMNKKIDINPIDKKNDIDDEKEKIKEDEEKKKVSINIVLFENKNLKITKSKLRVNPEKSYTVYIDLMNFRLNSSNIKRLLKSKTKIIIMNGVLISGYNRGNIVMYTDDADDKLVVKTLGRKISAYKTKLSNSIKKLESSLESYLSMIAAFDKSEIDINSKLKDLKSMVFDAPALRKKDFDLWEENEDEEDDDWFEGSQVHVLTFEPYKYEGPHQNIKKINDKNYKKSISYPISIVKSDYRDQKLWYNVNIGDKNVTITSDIITNGLIQKLNSNHRCIIYLDDSRKDAYEIAKQNLMTFYLNQQQKIKNIKSQIGGIENTIKTNKESLKIIQEYNGRDIYNMGDKKSLEIKIDN